MLFNQAYLLMDTTTSVIIATMNRPRELEAMLPTLLAQSRLPDEIIVVDQNPNSSTKYVVECCATRVAETGSLLPRIIYIHAPNADTPNAAGAGAARNIGIERATGDVLVFLDDDVLLEKEFAEELIAAYDRDNALGGVSGIITNYSRPTFPSRLIRRLFWVGPFHDERQPIYWNADQLRHHNPVRVRKFGSGVMSIKRAVSENVRFDQGGGSGFPGEDIDLSWRISEHSFLVIAPRARLVHLRSGNGRPSRHWLGLDAQGNHYLYQRIWKTKFVYKLCFTWLNIGYIVIATVASLRRLSTEPWRAFIKGARQGFYAGRVNL
jgi:glucosyl-dolichyl phosphate glucuronosyltransferase